jgi:hypothetical protein
MPSHRPRLRHGQSARALADNESELARFSRTAITATALVVLDLAGTRLLQEFALAEQLFAGGARGVTIAALTALLLCGRFVLCFVLPGLLVGALVFSIRKTWIPHWKFRTGENCKATQPRSTIRK